MEYKLRIEIGGGICTCDIVAACVIARANVKECVRKRPGEIAVLRDRDAAKFDVVSY